MNRIGEIELEGMEFHAYHGCLEHERREGNRFVVDFRGKVDMCAAAESDRLEDTLDYGAIYDLVAEEMKQPSQLLEHVAGRIVRRIEAEFPQLTGFSVRVSKQNPPVAGETAWSRVTLSSCNTTLSCDIYGKQ